jgi:hypothetical protein
MEEKLRLAAQMQQREVDYLQESHQRELASLSAEIAKLEFQLQRSLKEEGQVTALRRDNRRLAELHEDTDRILQKQTAELSLLRREIQQLRLQLRHHEEKEAKMALQQHSESQLEKRLREEVAELQKEQITEAERRKQLEGSLSRLRQEKEQLERNADLMLTQIEGQKEQLAQEWKAKIERI